MNPEVPFWNIPSTPAPTCFRKESKVWRTGTKFIDVETLVPGIIQEYSKCFHNNTTCPHIR